MSLPSFRQCSRSISYQHRTARTQTTILLTFAAFFSFTSVMFYLTKPLQFRVSFTKPLELENLVGGIDIAIKLRGLGDQSDAEGRPQFRTLIRSIYKHAQEKPLHLILLTDKESVPILIGIMKGERIPFYYGNGQSIQGSSSSAIIHGRPQPIKVPIYVEFVDIDLLRFQVEEWAWALKSFFNHHGGTYSIIKPSPDENNDTVQVTVVQFGEKYNDNMFYLTPFYHKLFPLMGKLIVLDADLEFKVDAAVLHAEFSKFTSDHLVGVANDLSPHYHQMFTGYRDRNPGTKVGMPGRLQGLNTGVLLLELDRIRNSEQYAYYLGWGGTAELADTYNFELGHIGDQDWLTLFGAAAPDLVYPLSCLFNRQLSTEYDEGIWMDIFKYFHECERLPENFVDGKPVDEAYILHGNSGASITEHNALKEAEARLRKKSDFRNQNVTVSIDRKKLTKMSRNRPASESKLKMKTIAKTKAEIEKQFGGREELLSLGHRKETIKTHHNGATGLLRSSN